MADQWANTDDHSPNAGGGWATTDNHAVQDQGLLSQIGTSFTNFGRDMLSAGHGATATADHLTANLFNLMDKGVDVISNVTGIPKGGAFRAISDRYRQAEQQEQQEAQRLAGGRNDLVSQVQRGGAQGLLEVPQYAVAAELGGAPAGMAALGALNESDKGFWPAMQAAATGGAAGAALTVMGPASRALRFTGAAAMTYAQSRLAGDDNTTAIAKATAMGGMNSISPGGVTAGEMVKNVVPEKIGGWYANPNPAAASASEYLQKKGVQVDAGSASGSPFLRRVTQMADSSPVGAMVARHTDLDNIGALQRTSADLVADATPETPAATHYGNFHAAVDDPANARDVPILDKDGKPMKDDKGNPVTRSVQMPVKVGDLKPVLGPIFEDMSWMTPADQASSPGYAAVKKILNGPDFITAAQAELGLSGIKKEAREGSNPRSVGLMKFITPQLQDMIDQSVGSVGGQDALDSLQAARKAAAAEAGADWLTDKFQIATQEGGFGHADRLWADWARLPNESKNTMFTPQQVGDLNDFFLGVKNLQQSANSSNTALTAHAMAQTGLVVSHPAVGIPTAIGTGALSKLLHSDWGVKLLTQGLRLKQGDPAARLVLNHIQNIVNWPPPEGGPGGGTPTTGGPGRNQPPSGSRPREGGPDVPQPGGATPAPVPPPSMLGGAGPAGKSVPQAYLQPPATGATVGSANATATADTTAAASSGTGRTVRGAPVSDATLPVGGPATPQEGRATSVIIPGIRLEYPARYEVVERRLVQPSHNPQTFQPNPQYGLANERDYSNVVNQNKVVEPSTRDFWNPRFHITDNPDAVNGPSVIDPNNNVYGGSSRAMMVHRVYDADPGSGWGYKDLLTQEAAHYGIDPDEVRSMSEPMLVRRIDTSQLTSGQRADAVANFNRSGTAPLTPSERAIADARRITPGSLQVIGDKLESLGPDATLAQALEGKSGTEILNRLIDDGVVSPQERAALTSEGQLTDAGKDRVSGLMLGRFFSNAKQMDLLPASIRGKMERIAAPAARVEGTGWDLSPSIKKALDLIEDTNSRNATIADVVKQGGLLENRQYSPESISFAQQLLKRNPNDLTNAVRKYVDAADYARDYQGPGLMGNFPEPKTPAQAWQESFGDQALKAETAAKNAARTAKMAAKATPKPGPKITVGDLMNPKNP